MSETPFSGWALVELLGHRQVAGLVAEEQIAGAGMLRIDVYRPGDTVPVASSLYSPSAVYAIHPCTEELARAAADRRASVPTPLYGLAAAPPAPRANLPLEGPQTGVECARCGHELDAHDDGPEGEGCLAPMNAEGDECGCRRFLDPADVPEPVIPSGGADPEPRYVPEPDRSADPCEACRHPREHHPDNDVCLHEACSCAGFVEDHPF